MLVDTDQGTVAEAGFSLAILCFRAGTDRLPRYTQACSVTGVILCTDIVVAARLAFSRCLDTAALRGAGIYGAGVSVIAVGAGNRLATATQTDIQSVTGITIAAFCPIGEWVDVAFPGLVIAGGQGAGTHFQRSTVRSLFRYIARPVLAGRFDAADGTAVTGGAVGYRNGTAVSQFDEHLQTVGALYSQLFFAASDIVVWAGGDLGDRRCRRTVRARCGRALLA